MSLRTFPVTHSRAPPSVGRRFSETARHDNRIKFARARNRHDRGVGSRPANACRSPGGIPQYHLDVAGSDYRRYGRHTRRQRCLIGFGADSIIEVASSCVLLWWLAEGSIESRSRDPSIGRRLLFCACRLHRNWRLVGPAKTGSAARHLFRHPLCGSVCRCHASFGASEASRRCAAEQNALHADSHQSDICAYLSAILLLGLALNAALGWWWADPMPPFACCQSSSAKASPAGVAKPVRTRIFEMD